MIIDAHTHLYPDELNRAPAQWADAHGEEHWKLMATRVRKNGAAVQGFPSLREFLETMDAAGIDRAVLLGWYWEKAESCRMQNRFYAECVKAHPDRLSAFAAVHPGDREECLREIRWAKEEGFAGVGELCPQAQGVAMQSEGLRDALALAEELGLAVNFHVTDSGLPKYPGRVETPVGELLDIARRHPRLQVILAHWGAKLWHCGEDIPANVWLDTAASPVLYAHTVFREALDAFPSGRIVWGSDYPLNLRAREAGEAREGWAAFLEESREALPEDLRAGVLGGNMAGVLRV